MITVWASEADARRVESASSAVFLVGSYDGSGNYGDVLQFAAALETVRRLPGRPLPVAIVERETLGHHRELLGRYPATLGSAAFLHCDSGIEAPEDDLVELGEGVAPRRAALYVYGGGFLNWRWGARKVEHAEVAERLSRGRSLPVVASGLQVDEATVAPGGAAHELLSDAVWVGVRDSSSLGWTREHVTPAGGPEPVLAGDDATPYLPRRGDGGDSGRPIVNLHLSEEPWISEDPETTEGRVVDILRQLGDASNAGLSLRPVIAYEDPRVSERRVAARLLDRHGPALSAAGIESVQPLDVLDEAVGGSLEAFHRARFTVACSYHVTLTSLMGSVPTLLLAENEYYEQKAAGLRDLFGLDGALVGARGDADDAESARAVLVDGAERGALVDRLGAASDSVEERFNRGRGEVVSTLADCLRRRGPLARFSRGLERVRSGGR